MPVTTRTSRARGKPHTPSEEIELDSNLSLPHVPLHISPLMTNDIGSEKEEMSDKNKSSLYIDRYNIALLTFLYVLQGIPLGLAGSIPYLLQSRKVNYKEQAVFSLVYWPFSVKLLWAPIVDAAYFPAFGRRKSWLVPTQYLIGVFMLVLSFYVGDLLGNGENGGQPVCIVTLTVIFFMLNFLAATQDIAVDGWALTMLARKNVGWASTCNTVGQTAGFFLGNVVFMALESADFCNGYLRSEPKDEGVVTLAGFLYFWGIVFFVTTTLVWVMKREKGGHSDLDPEQGIVDTYKLLWKIVNLKAVKSLIGILLTVKIGFAAADAVTGLKLIEEGVPKEKLALLGVPMVPIQIILPLIISKYTAGPTPMNIFLKAMPYRLLMGVVFGYIVYWAPSTKTSEGVYPLYFYLVVVFVYALHQVTLYCMFVAIMGFHAKISDPKIGGSYMTLLNTFANLGGNWPSTVALWLVDGLTWRTCSADSPAPGACRGEDGDQVCEAAGGSCFTSLDGYYLESAFCILVGLLWLRWRSRRVRELDALPLDQWTCSN